ncbi:MAG TPA: DUF192 domain-containing protein [Lacunisphaera sp.]|nr:DUF192 domain-containing protein [Lacunisphaera sp.]
MFSHTPWLRPLTFLAALALAGCGRATPAADEGNKTVDDWFAIKVGDHPIRMQLAVRAEEQQKGLMFRATMATDEGMLFVFDRPQPMGFWMRNTELPLDIGYFDHEGVLKEIYPMYPHDERTVSSRSREIQFCLEMNQGWYRQNGVRPGSRLEMSAVVAGLKARGFKPESFGLH